MTKPQNDNNSKSFNSRSDILRSCPFSGFVRMGRFLLLPICFSYFTVAIMFLNIVLFAVLYGRIFSVEIMLLVEEFIDIITNETRH